MNWKKRLLKKSRLYVIIDNDVLGRRSFLYTARALKDGACDIIQFRDKTSKKEVIVKRAFALRKLLLKSATLFIINDFLDIAKIIDSDGVHLGQDDSSIEIARKILGEDKIIGLSCHNLRQAKAAEEKGADYISIGPVFKTSTKPQRYPIGLDLIKKTSEKIKIPFFAIGGINPKNINHVLSSGAKNIAACGALCQAKNINQTMKNFKRQLMNLR